MVGRSLRGRATNGPFNWLQDLDSKAKSLPRANSWLQPYGPFMLARYPNLRPLPVLGNVRSQITSESDERTATQLFAEWELRIAGNPQTASCLARLVF